MPMDIRPLPVPAVDPEDIPSLLYADTVFIRCLGYIQLKRYDPDAPTSTAPYNTWDLAFESQWRKFHPKVWEIPEDDDKKDWDEIYRLEGEWVRESLRGGMTGEEVDEFERVYDKLRNRVITRSKRLLALTAINQARNAILGAMAACNPGLTIDEFLKALPTGDLSRFATSPAVSLWPLPSIPPPCKGLTLVNLTNLLNHVVPSHPSAAYDAYLAEARSLIPTAAPASSSSSSTGEQNQLLQRRRNAGKRDSPHE